MIMTKLYYAQVNHLGIELTTQSAQSSILLQSRIKAKLGRMLLFRKRSIYFWHLKPTKRP